MYITSEEHKEYLELKKKRFDVNTSVIKKTQGYRDEIKLLKGTIKARDYAVESLNERLNEANRVCEELMKDGISVKVSRESISSTSYCYDGSVYEQRYRFKVTSKYLSKGLRTKLEKIFDKICGYKIKEGNEYRKKYVEIKRLIRSMSTNYFGNIKHVHLLRAIDHIEKDISSSSEMGIEHIALARK